MASVAGIGLAPLCRLAELRPGSFSCFVKLRLPPLSSPVNAGLARLSESPSFSCAHSVAPQRGGSGTGHAFGLDALGEGDGKGGGEGEGEVWPGRAGPV